MGNIAIIMAAGEGKRMRSALPKVMHRVGGRPMIDCVIDAAAGTTDEKPVVVVGNCREQVISYLGDRAHIAVQEQQKGTGHAVMMAMDYLEQTDGYAIVLAGDMPLLQPETIAQLLRETEERQYDATILTSIVQNPSGYGRVVRLSDYTVSTIVEERDADECTKDIKEINSSVYCFDAKLLIDCLGKLSNHNQQGEYYLTDVISMMVAMGKRVGAMTVSEEESMGVNNRIQLAEAESALRMRTACRLMDAGVSIIDPMNTYIDSRAEIGCDTIIYPGVIIEGACNVGSGCLIYSGTRLSKSNVGDGCTIDHSVLVQVEVGDNANIGPFAYLRPGTKLHNNCKVGDFVEIKNASIGDGTKIPHLTYVGDATVGMNVNIGCGTAFANYDGKNKYHTNVGDNCFIGCNNVLVSPVELHDGAYTAAGSTITGDVPAGSLAVARAEQRIKEGWAEKRRQEGKLK